MTLKRNALTVAVTACFGTQFAYANPVGPAVVSGQATFVTQGSLLSVTYAWRHHQLAAILDPG